MNIKPIALTTKHYSNEEIKERLEKENAIKGDSKIPIDAPDNLNLCELGKVYYKSIVEYMPQDLFNYLDSYTVGICADSLAKMSECREILNREGLIVEGKQHSAVKTYNSYSQIFNIYGGKMGMSPTDRAKLSLIQPSKEQDEDSIESYLNI